MTEDLIKSKTVFVCPYCGKESDSRKEIIECLDSHSIVFIIEEDKGSHDCWGNYESNYVETDIVFKHYIDACAYCGQLAQHRLKIKEIR